MVAGNLYVYMPASYVCVIVLMKWGMLHVAGNDAFPLRNPQPMNYITIQTLHLAVCVCQITFIVM